MCFNLITRTYSLYKIFIFLSLNLPKHRTQLSRVTRHVLNTLDISVLFDSVWFYQGIDLPYPCLKVSGDWEGGVKDVFPCSIVPVDSKQAITIIHRDSALRKERGDGLPGPPSKNAALLKACSSPHRWHVRFPAWPISCRIFTTEAQYRETSEPRRSVLVWMKWLQHNYCCYVLLFDQMLLFFMPDVLSICVITCKSILLHITHEI